MTIALALVSVVLATSVAHADCGPGQSSGSGTVYKGPAPSRGSASWSASARSLSFSAVAWTMPAPKCQTTYFDWGTSDGAHYDARAARTCQSAGSRSGSVTGESSAVAGIQKFGVCYDDKDTSINSSVCADASISVCSVTSINPVPIANKAVAWWLRSASGSLTTVSGGDRRDANN